MINVLWDKMQISSEERKEIENLSGYHIDTLRKVINKNIDCNKYNKLYIYLFYCIQF